MKTLVLFFIILRISILNSNKLLIFSNNKQHNNFQNKKSNLNNNQDDNKSHSKLYNKVIFLSNPNSKNNNNLNNLNTFNSNKSTYNNDNQIIQQKLIEANINNFKFSANNKFNEFKNYSKSLNIKNEQNEITTDKSFYTFDMNSLVKNSVDLPILNDYISGDFINNSNFSYENLKKLKNVSVIKSDLPEKLVKQALKVNLNSISPYWGENVKELNPIILPIFQLNGINVEHIEKN